jgi:hypothetical protein
MDDQTLPADRAPDDVCPWCSAALTADPAVCPSCGAILTADDEPDLPGVTAVDEKVARGVKRPGSRSRLLSWISGDNQDDLPSQADAQALAPPDPEVQHEILRLELEAHVAKLQAEADANLSDAMLEGRAVDVPDGLRSFATGEADETQQAPAEPSEDASTSDDGVPTGDDVTAGASPP